MLCWFLLYANVNHSILYIVTHNFIYIYIIYLLPLSLPLPFSHSTLQVITKLQAGLSVLYSSFSPAIYFRGTN